MAQNVIQLSVAYKENKIKSKQTKMSNNNNINNNNNNSNKIKNKFGSRNKMGNFQSFLRG